MNEYKELPDGFVAHRYTIIDTSTVKQVVYKIVSSEEALRYNVSTHNPNYDGTLVDITSEFFPIPPSELPYGSDERHKAVKQWRHDRKEKRDSLLKQAFEPIDQNILDQVFFAIKSLGEREWTVKDVRDEIDRLYHKDGGSYYLATIYRYIKMLYPRLIVAMC